jgi:murein DD-endopeptidase MepM/ murein hydrolase activator NlpD
MDKTQFMKRVFKDSYYQFNSGYGYRIHPITHLRTFHYGEDYGTNKIKCPLFSPVFGIVTESTYNAIRGNYVTIKTVFGLVRMQHLTSRAVSVGQEVAPGQQIGVAGTTGSSTGVHLHIEYKTLAGVKLDPAVFIPLYAETHSYPDALPTATVTTERGTFTNIMRWQKFLCWYCSDVSKDGHFGNDTKAKTMAFQGNTGLFVDGKAGPATREKAKLIKRT